jgi:CheY-like chemotaxis protein
MSDLPRALLVEDEALVAMVAEELLASLGFEVLSARNAQEAMAMLADGATPAVALVDVGLPGVRGDTLAEQLRASTPQMPVLMATGYDNSDLRERFAHDAGVGFLAKPYSEMDLDRALASFGLQVTRS